MSVPFHEMDQTDVAIAISERVLARWLESYEASEHWTECPEQHPECDLASALRIAMIALRKSNLRSSSLLDQLCDIAIAMRPLKGHFCGEWDGLYIYEGMMEMDSCLCRFGEGPIPSEGNDPRRAIRAVREAGSGVAQPEELPESDRVAPDRSDDSGSNPDAAHQRPAAPSERRCRRA